MKGCQIQQQGFTLVELMVALLIGLVIMLGASQLFVASKRSYDQLGYLAERQEVLRFLSDVLTLDVRTATGFDISGIEGRVLNLDYEGVRDDDPYCSSGDLTGMVYEFKENSLFVNPECSGVLKGEQPVLGGVKDGAFCSTAGEVCRFHVEIYVELPAMDEEDEDISFRFRAANRESVISQL